MRKIHLLPLILLVLLSACNLPSLAASTPTPGFTFVPPTATPVTPTATITLTETLTPTLAPTFTPTIMPTSDPIIGVVRAPTNVRSGPGKGGNERIGGVFYNQNVKVIGRNDAANWLYIIFDEAPTGTGWVLASAIQLRGDLTTLPIYIYNDKASEPVGYAPILYQITGTPEPLNQPLQDAKTATLTQLSNVRVCPSVGCMAIGILQPGAIVAMTGRVAENYWVQIQYPSGIDGRGWIATSLLKPKDGYGGLPYYNLLGTPVTPETPGAEEAQPTQTLSKPTIKGTGTPSASATPRPTEISAATGTPTEVFPTPEGPTGHTKTQVNVRAGPMQNSDLLGVLNAKELVLITGRNLIGNWLQIEYPANSGQRGWVAADYIDLAGVRLDKLPYYDNLGTPLP